MSDPSFKRARPPSTPAWSASGSPSFRGACSVLFSPLLLLVLLIAGCAGSERSATGSQDAGSAAQDEGERYMRRVTPFPVRGADGEAYDHPFLGGFNVPRPQITDINGDGAQDLFIQEESDQLMFFENTAGPDSSADLAWRSSDYRGLDVGEWYRFIDLDADKLPDLLAEQPYSYLRYYHNTGTPTSPNFELVQDTLRTVDGEPLFSDRQNIPNVTDIDCDSRPDLFVGRLDGTVTRYEATGRVEDGVPRFRLVAEEFEGIEIVAQVSQPGGPAPPARPTPGQRKKSNNPLGRGGNDDENVPLPGGSARHGANTMAFADVDDDEDQDLLWGDYFEPGLLLLENTGSCENPTFTSDPVPFPRQNPLQSSGYNAPAFGDLTGDGLRDLLVGVIGGAYNPDRTAAANLYFYEQTSGGAYRLRTRRFLSMIDVGSESRPALGDLDADDDDDLLVGNKLGTAAAGTNRASGQVLRFENTGTPGAPAYRLTDTLALAPKAYNYAPALTDLTGDGQLDLVIGTWNKGVRLHRNTGTAGNPQFSEQGERLVQLERGSHAAPAFADLDDDGDQDLVVGETAGGLTFFRNTGTSAEPQFEQAPGVLEEVRVDRRSVPALRDTDGDGDQDLLVGTEGGGLVFFRNEGTAETPQFTRVEKAGRFALEVPDLASPVFADVDGDGDADLFTGAARGGLLFYEHQR